MKEELDREKEGLDFFLPFSNGTDEVFRSTTIERQAVMVFFFTRLAGPLLSFVSDRSSLFRNWRATSFPLWHRR